MIRDLTELGTADKYVRQIGPINCDSYTLLGLKVTPGSLVISLTAGALLRHP